jgi:hypothetical protein
MGIFSGKDVVADSLHTRPAVYIFAALGLYLACLALPSITVARSGAPELGGSYLVTGWMGPAAGHFEWFANPCIYGAAYFLARGRDRAALFWSVVAMMLITTLLGSREIVAGDGAMQREIVAFHSGYWLWLASAGTLFLGGLVRLVAAQRQRT